MATAAEPGHAERELYFSFFMFTANLRPADANHRREVVRYVEKLSALGYAGFDVPVAPPENEDWGAELRAYAALRAELDGAGFADVPLSTNVGATRTYDPTSPYAEQRAGALRYLKSRVDITAALRGPIMAGPIIFPYAVFPQSDAGEELWSDALQEWAAARRGNARPVLEELAEHAAARGVSLAIEPVDHWETPWPNLVSEVLACLDGLPAQLGACVDSAHVQLGADGPAAFAAQIEAAGAAGRIHSVHISPPDRGHFEDSWIPWQLFFGPILSAYRGPILVETFNAVAPFTKFLRLGRRKFWVPGEDDPVPGVRDAFTVAERAITVVREQIAAVAAGGR
jgi:sugar phosphate isomerase/epimerase